MVVEKGQLETAVRTLAVRPILAMVVMVVSPMEVTGATTMVEMAVMVVMETEMAATVMQVTPMIKVMIKMSYVPPVLQVKLIPGK